MEDNRNFEFIEQEENGSSYHVVISNGSVKIFETGTRKARGAGSKSVDAARDLLVKMFLPAGYPSTVTPDYLRFQILNALQAFCSSLSGLLSSRAILEGFGVGDANATATNALLLTILQDISSRITTIVGAYWLGSLLYPEAKTYRFVADILNDVAIALETLLPLFTSPSSPLYVPGSRVGVLCLSASLRSLCGVTAGGAKAAIALHFASPVTGTGDVGDLNAKDSSKETVLALFGMLLGTWAVPKLTTPIATYFALLVLILLHLMINYAGVRGLQLRALNRQRATLLWTHFIAARHQKVLTHGQVAKHERLFDIPGTIRDISEKKIGHVEIGTSLTQAIGLGGIYDPRPFRDERYLLVLEPSCFSEPTAPQIIFRSSPKVHICLQQGYTQLDQLKAWVHAVEMCRLARPGVSFNDCAQKAALQIRGRFADFVKELGGNAWKVSETMLLVGPPKGITKSPPSPEKAYRGSQ